MRQSGDEPPAKLTEGGLAERPVGLELRAELLRPHDLDAASGEDAAKEPDSTAVGELVDALALEREYPPGSRRRVTLGGMTPSPPGARDVAFTCNTLSSARSSEPPTANRGIHSDRRSGSPIEPVSLWGLLAARLPKVADRGYS